ncbi:MAG: hypothetical protein AAFX05_13190 [Planctomycetota bacterium]
MPRPAKTRWTFVDVVCALAMLTVIAFVIVMSSMDRTSDRDTAETREALRDPGSRLTTPSP